MTRPLAEDVRSLLKLNANEQSGTLDEQINPKITAAIRMLEERTGRFFEDRPGLTWTKRTYGHARIKIRGFRTITTATRSGNVLVQTAAPGGIPDFWLLEDDQHSGIYTELQFSGLGASRLYPYLNPNDLVLVGDAGYADDDLPSRFLDAAIILSAWKVKRPDSVLTETMTTPEGAVVDLSRLPVEVRQFIHDWSIEDWF